jgi:molybdenum cofactor guanylyltransferase
MRNIQGAVLCGGASRRMGTDKALIDIGGVPMAERVARVLESAGCRPVVFVGGDPVRLGELGRRVVADRWPGEGPLGGVLTALAELATADAVVVAACDLAALTPDVVRAVVGSPDGGPDVRVADSGRLEPTLALWPATARDPLESAFAAGRRALHEALDAVASTRVAVDPLALRNVNRRADLANLADPHWLA